LLRPDYKTHKHLVWLDHEIDSWINQKLLRHDIAERLLWGRTLMNTLTPKLKDSAKQPGLSPTFCGHTYAEQVRQCLSHICLDTGAFRSLEHTIENFGLCLFDVQEYRSFSASYRSDTVKVKQLRH
jgi:serine/threonine protein phosphatase 1